MDYFGKATSAAEKHAEQAALEKLKLKLMEYIADKNNKINPILKEYLESIEGCTEVRDDESEDNPEGYIVVIDGYEFRVSADGSVLESLGKATSPMIIVTQNGKNIELSITERGENVTVLEILNNTDQVIASATKESMTKNEQSYVFNHSFADEGTYVVKLTTQEGNIYKKKITIDLTPPSTPVISSDYGYPVITEYGVQQGGTTTITYDTGDNFENYYSFDNKNWNEYKEPFQYAQIGTIYAKSIKKSNGLVATAQKTISIPSDVLPAVCYDGDLNTNNSVKSRNATTKNYYMNVDNSVIGKQFSVTYQTAWNVNNVNWLNISFYNESGAVISSTEKYANTTKTTIKLTIPENTVKIKFQCFSNSNYATTLYEVRLNIEPVISNEKIYPKLTLYGIERGFNNMTINYFPTSEQRLYSLDGDTWYNYQDKAIKVDYGTTIYAKGIDKYGKSTNIVSLTSNEMSDALPTICYDDDLNTNNSVKSRNATTKNYYMNVDNSVIGKQFLVTYQTADRARSVNRLTILFYNESGTVISSNEYINTTKTTIKLTIPENTVKINFQCFSTSNYATTLYEVNI